MIPIRNVKDFCYAWTASELEDRILFGFLLYTTSDLFFPDYLRGSGLSDLEMWSGKNSAIFVIHSPSHAWIEYAKIVGHPWWKLFGSTIANDHRFEDILTNVKGAVLEIDGEKKTLEQVFAVHANEYLFDHEISTILGWFDLDTTVHPCIVLFEDIEDEHFWFADMKPLVDLSIRDLRNSLHNWFRTDFHRLMRALSR